MARHLTIVTGASRGMGQAIAAQLIEAGHEVLGISRKTSPDLKCEQWPQDLARADVAAARLETWLEGKASQGWDSVTLINNAALLPKVGPLANLGLQELSDAIRVDLEAPLLLTSSFLRATQNWKAQRKVLNISSGLGRRAMASQALYCAAKAGMDHFTRCVALEEAQRPNGAKVCSLAPGVIDTDMQAQLRAADGSRFPDQGNFFQLQRSGQLSSPHDAAARVIAFLQRADFGREPVADVRSQ